MDIFGWFFPESIINWCCDDWYNWVYHPNYFYPLRKHFCSNEGGQPRYIINNQATFRQHNTFHKNVDSLRKTTHSMAQKHKLFIKRYIKQIKTNKIK